LRHGELPVKQIGSHWMVVAGVGGRPLPDCSFLAPRHCLHKDAPSARADEVANGEKREDGEHGMAQGIKDLLLNEADLPWLFHPAVS
jgi:hypothetical protein